MLSLLSKLLVILCAAYLCSCGTSHVEESKVAKDKEYNLAGAASYNTQLGLAYLKQGNKPRAKKKLLTALKQAPDSPGVNAAMAYFFESTGDNQDAGRYYKKAMQLAPGSGSQYNNYGAFLCRNGQYQEADKYFNLAVKDIKYEKTAAAYENAGLCALENKQFDKAEGYFRHALDQDSSRKVSLYELVKLELKEKKYHEVLHDINKHPKIVLKSETLLKMAAKAANKIGDDKLASRYLTQIQSLDG